jgi:hypothetical protein
MRGRDRNHGAPAFVANPSTVSVVGVTWTIRMTLISATPNAEGVAS